MTSQKFEDMTIAELEAKIATTQTEAVKKSLQALLEKKKLAEDASKGSDVAKMLLLVTEMYQKSAVGGGGGGGASVAISQSDIAKAVADALASRKIGLSDLDKQLSDWMTSQAKVSLRMTTLVGTVSVSDTISDTLLKSPLFQRMLTDAIALNNIYLYGTAGSGKTYIAEELARFLNYDYIEINCNQYTSPLEIIGGQTIDGYQEGKLIRAWGNLNQKGNAPSGKNGCVLCIDEMPKIDPNTAGLFNSALAKVKRIEEVNGVLRMPTIENAQGVKVTKGNLIIIATGNVKLNEISAEYEANFKQDLSLQDRFAGSTYRVDYDYESEWNDSMTGFAFIFIPLIKLREKIVEERLTGFGFISRRIMLNLRDTYKKYREAKDQKISVADIQKALVTPKTVIDGIDTFLKLFKSEAMQKLKDAMDYDNWVQIARSKDNLPMADLDTAEEKREVAEMIERNKANRDNF